MLDLQHSCWIPAPYRVRGRLFAGMTVGFPGFPRRTGEGGFQTHPYRRERLSASNIAYRRADTWVRVGPASISCHPFPRGEGGFQTRPYGSRATGSGAPGTLTTG